MASYTMQLKTIIEQPTQYDKGLSIRKRIEVGRRELFDFPYPFHDEDYRGVFETNIIRKFYTREIGFETEELFKFQLETWMLINMPYYNELFKSQLIEYDPLTNAQMVVAHEKKSEKDQLDDRNILKNSVMDGRDTGNVVTDTSGTEDKTTDSTELIKNDSTDNTNQSFESSDTSLNTTSGTSSQITDSTGENIDDNFNRKVGSDNPDSRLQLQTLDGKGIIEYASKIDEDKANNKTNTKGHSTGSGETDSTSQVDSSGDSSGISNTVISGTVDSSGNVISGKQTTGNKVTDSVDTTNLTTNADQNDILKSNVNEVEQFIERRFGKVGITSYPQLIMDFRKAMLRIEVQIHKDMQELFMLIY